MSRLNPRAIVRSLARVDSMADQTRALEKQIDGLQGGLEKLRIQTEQLATIQRLNWELQREYARLDRLLDAERIAAHVAEAVRAAPLVCEPFPHVVVTDWLPADVYEAVVRAVPPPIFFADREERRQRLTVPFDVAPAYSYRVWQFLCNDVVAHPLARALNDTFASTIERYVRSFCPQLPLDADLALHPSDGRIMLRRPGYVIEPHRDPRWGFVTGLAYLARPGDNEAYGTQLYRVRDDVEAPSERPYYIESARCELVETVPFRPNTLLVFLNSTGAHGASIPADAMPADLTRLVYQFRLGPRPEAIRRILACMPSDKRPVWTGSKSGRPAYD